MSVRRLRGSTVLTYGLISKVLISPVFRLVGLQAPHCNLYFAIRVKVICLISLLRSRFLGCHATLPPKKRLLTTEQHSFLIVLVFCLRSVEQTNHIAAKSERRKLSREKSGCDRQSIASLLIMAHETPRKIVLSVSRVNCCALLMKES